jgi:hypothetical protein
MIDGAIGLVQKTYGSFTPGDFFTLKHALCRFFQERRVKVSLFLQDGLQNLDGSMVLDMSKGKCVPAGTDLPGVARYFDGLGSIQSTAELASHGLISLVKNGTLATAPRDDTEVDCVLGDNLYAKNRTAPNSSPESGKERKGPGDSSIVGSGRAPGQSSTALAELNVLASLIGSEGGASVKPIPVDLFACGDDPFFGQAVNAVRGADWSRRGNPRRRHPSLRGVGAAHGGGEAKHVGDGESLLPATTTLQINGNTGRKDLRTQMAELDMDSCSTKAPGKVEDEDESDLLSFFDAVKD